MSFALQRNNDRTLELPSEGSRPSSGPASKKLIPLLFVISTIIIFIAKEQAFYGMSYVVDIFYYVHASHSFLLGRPLFFDTTFGMESWKHNYLLLPLLAPFTLLVGAHALFLLHGVMTVAAGWSVIRASELTEGAKGYMILVLTLLTGPIIAWGWDNQTYGWHIELLYIPLSALFSLELLKNSAQGRWRVWLWGGMIALLREDGPVLAWALHIVCYSARHTDLLSRELWYGVILRTLGWLALFFSHVGLMLFVGDSSGGRMTTTLASIPVHLSRPGIPGAYGKMLKDTALLLGSGLITAALGAPIRMVVISLLVLLPIFIVNVVSASLYLTAPINAFHFHGAAWPARFAMMWGVLLALGLTTPFARGGKKHSFRIFLSWWVWGPLTLLSWYTQSWALTRAREYNVMEFIGLPFGVTTKKLPLSKLTPSEREVLGCLSESVPTVTSVVLTGEFVAWFHRHDTVRGVTFEKAWVQPELIVCDTTQRFEFDAECISAFAKGQYERTSIEGLTVGYVAPLEDSVRKCVSTDGKVL